MILPHFNVLLSKCKLVVALTVVALLSACSTQDKPSELKSSDVSIQLLEQVDAAPGTPAISYAKYQLDNGLTLILAPDHSDPLVHVDVTYHVGSAREEIGKSGFAHFFEHMMFQGSKHVADQEHFKLITQAGGSLNGTTNSDRTNYFETVPSNQLEKVLWLESDRMGFLLEAVSQRKFEIQRSTVKNERAQNYENRPYGMMWEKMGEAMYPEGHPYSWQTIGYVEDLDKVDVNDLKAFFLRWYGPNNAVLTIGGDFDTQQVLQWVDKYFGSIPKGPEVEAAPKQPAVLSEDRYVTVEDRIQQPMLVIGWPTTYLGEEHTADLNVLARVLGSGRNSILYQKLVKTGKALDAGAFHRCEELSCNFYVYVMADSKKRADLTPLYNEVYSIIEKMKVSDIDPDVLQQVIGSAEASSIFALQSVHGKVAQLASNETFYHQPDRLQIELDRLQKVTPNSIYKSYQAFIHNQHKVTLSVVPRGKPQLAAKEATFITPPRTLPEHQTVYDSDLEYRFVEDNFDRSVTPEVQSSVTGTMPELYSFHLNNDIEVLGSETSETPTVMMQIKMPAGNRYAPRGKEGLATLTASMVAEGSELLSSEAFQAELDKLGSAVSLNAGQYATILTISSLSKHFTETMALVEKAFFHPLFSEDDFARVKRQMLEGVIYEHQTPSWLASQATREVLYGNSIYARSSSGTQASVKSFTLQDVKAFHNKFYTPKGTQILVVGDITERQVKRELASLQQWQGEVIPMLRRDKLTKPTQQTLFVVDKPGAPQSVVRLVRRGLPFDATGESYLAQLANFNLGGNFNSRINQNLREDKGYTYGASSYVTGNREVGAFVVSAQVRADSTAPAIEELIKEMDKAAKEGFTDKEIEFMRLAVGQQDALKYETPEQKAYLLSSILTYNLDHDYLATRNNIVANVTKQTLNEVASQWFKAADYQIIVVGDAKQLMPQIKTLNFPIQTLEIEP
ncbi:M16 family metallopeptidase [Vibrio ezurae]|uniref:Peptidase M16 family protein n=1 Tax=Vibrio ezurae NBRC 102218 TaxID=1219080 RepID=U3CB27_9VIBR|nr:pitrilysin family protein [Vibrio ezurae]GAD78534.1 peptidase M16 family protein [Vibrio ezurae NBRC 102218]